MLARLTTKGQITIPRKIRSALHLSYGDYIDFKCTGTKAVFQKKQSHSTARDLIGIIPNCRYHSDEEIADAKKKATAAKWGKR